MDYLRKKMPEFFRVAWTSPEARALWEPRIKQLQKRWNELEILSVERGIRPAALQVVSVDNLVGFSRSMLDRGLKVLPIESTGWKSGYANLSSPGNSAFRCLIYKGTIYDTKDPGLYLGYPLCCQKFFKKYWVDQGLIDLTWPQAQPTDKVVHINEFSFICNVLLRYLGVRLVSHLPCSYTCKGSIELGNQFLNLWRSVGDAEEIAWVSEILNWPIHWSSLHGIAEIKAPVLKISANTELTADKCELYYHGKAYPEHGATGIVFPFKKTILPIVRNGFKNAQNMTKCHEDLIYLLTQSPVTITKYDDRAMVIDMGCGDGTLLSKLRDELPWIEPVGVDTDLKACDSADKLGIHTLVGSISSFNWKEVAPLLFMIAKERIDEGFDPLQLTNARWVLCYSYGQLSPEINLPGFKLVKAMSSKNLKAGLYASIDQGATFNTAFRGSPPESLHGRRRLPDGWVGSQIERRRIL